ncbi:MAG: uracil-DNA glycosylase family protein, partial [Bacteroidota bacterium]
HVRRYCKLGKIDVVENRSKFMEYAERSMPWMEKEIEICNPYVILLLGVEVTRAFFNVSDKEAKAYLDGTVRQKEINGQLRNFICLPHPGILMKKYSQNPWPERFEKEIAGMVKGEIGRLKK